MYILLHGKMAANINVCIKTGCWHICRNQQVWHSLEKGNIFFPSNSKVKVTYETIDYKTKALKTQSTSVMDVPNIEMYHEDMNVDSGDYRWENYYNK